MCIQRENLHDLLEGRREAPCKPSQLKTALHNSKIVNVQFQFLRKSPFKCLK